MAKRTCSIDGCDRPYEARGWCNAHYLRWRKHGDPLAAVTAHDRAPGTPIERFWAKVDRDGPVPECRPDLGRCWLWTGALWRGYGRTWPTEGRTIRAHRFAYELLVGPIPDGLVLDHLCRVRHCVNPAHLEPVTSAENVLRGEGPPAANARKTHCVNGHEFTPENTYTKSGWRRCRACTLSISPLPIEGDATQ